MGYEIERKEIFIHDEDREDFLAEPVKCEIPPEKMGVDIGPETIVAFEKEIGKIYQSSGFA